MSIAINFTTVLIKKSAVLRWYMGGVSAFLSDFPSALEDGYLYGIVSMSGDDTHFVLNALRNKGIEPERSCAIADMHHGAIEPHPHFLFRNTSLDFPPQWVGQLIADEPGVLAEDGSNLLTWLMRHDQKLYFPPSNN